MQRGDCLPGGFNAMRPCPYERCRHHVLEVVRSSYARASRPLSEDGATCTLDVADDGVHSLDEVGEVLGLSRQRVNQIVQKGMALFRFAIPPEPR